MAKKIAMIGAGSVVFCKTLIQDILATPALQDSEFALMSPTESCTESGFPISLVPTRVDPRRLVSSLVCLIAVPAEFALAE